MLQADVRHVQVASVEDARLCSTTIKNKKEIHSLINHTMQLAQCYKTLHHVNGSVHSGRSSLGSDESKNSAMSMCCGLLYMNHVVEDGRSIGSCEQVKLTWFGREHATTAHRLHATALRETPVFLQHTYGGIKDRAPSCQRSTQHSRTVTALIVSAIGNGPNFSQLFPPHFLPLPFPGQRSASCLTLSRFASQAPA